MKYNEILMQIMKYNEILMKSNETQWNSQEIQWNTTKYNKRLMRYSRNQGNTMTYNETQQNTIKYNEMHTKCNEMLRVSCLGSSPSLRTPGLAFPSCGLVANWLLVSEPGFFRVLADFGRILFFMWEFRSISNIVY